ncbi:MAG: cysteine desulfurase family protein [Spirochaetales bacterium]|nr:cysteine desulfurase family protein [Spirochaetales bacterium]
MIYLDWAATTPPLNDVLSEMTEIGSRYFGNPSSIHTEGQKAHEKLEEIRNRCAEALICRSDELVFTSGGTESNNIIISSLLNRRDKGRIIVSGIEHPAIWNPVQMLGKQGWEVKVINPGSDGLIKANKLKKLLTPDTKMVCIMGVHNETGVIQPLEELVRTVREFDSPRPIHFHSDLVQSAGKTPLSLDEMDLDSAAFAAHKIQGPRGIGLLYQKKPLAGLYAGGGQEKGLRPGTENLAAAAGMCAALEQAIKVVEDHLDEASLRMQMLMTGISAIPGARLLPEGRMDNAASFSPWILNVSFPPLPGEVLVRVMDEAGFCISTGSACSSKKKSRTRGLEAMGIDAKTAFSSIRVSQGPSTTDDEIRAFIKALEEQIRIVGRAVG